MRTDPFRRAPMVDFEHPAGQSLFWRISDAMERLVEQLENHSPAELLVQKIDRDIAQAERDALALSGGTGMTNVQDARLGIMAGHQSGLEANAHIGQAINSTEAALGQLRHAVEGSNQPEADEANAELAAAIDKLEEARAQVVSALSKFESVAQAL